MSTPPEPEPREGEVVDLPERSIMDLLRDIRSGDVNPKLLTAEEKKLCVLHLTAECGSVSEIAQALKTSERTVYRIRRQIQEEQAVTPDPKFTSMFAGKILHETESLRAQVHRILRDKEAPHAARVEAARVSHEMLDKTAARLQSMGFLHTATVRTETDVTVRNGDIDSLEKLRDEVERLTDIKKRHNPDSPATKEPKDPKGDSQ